MAGSKWEASVNVSHERDCTLCGKRFRFENKVAASSTRSAEDAEQKLREGVETELAKDVAQQPVKCCWCKKMPHSMWVTSFWAMIFTLIFGWVAAGIGVAICFALLGVAMTSGFLFWGLLLFVGVMTASAALITPFVAIGTLLAPQKSFPVEAAP